MAGAVRTAVVTGSARRVGRVVAQALVEAGWQVLVHARDAGAARDAARDLGASASVGADLARLDGIDAVAIAARGAFPDGLGLLVNSAASFERVDAWGDAGADGWARAMDVNARAPYLLTCALLDALRRGGGSVVNVSDRAAREHWPAFPVHAAAKAALESLTISGARALAGEGVRVNGVVPGTVLAPDDWSEARVEREREAGRLGTTDLLVRTVVALAEDGARTGELVEV